MNYKAYKQMVQESFRTGIPFSGTLWAVADKIYPDGLTQEETEQLLLSPGVMAATMYGWVTTRAEGKGKHRATGKTPVFSAYCPEMVDSIVQVWKDLRAGKNPWEEDKDVVHS